MVPDLPRLWNTGGEPCTIQCIHPRHTYSMHCIRLFMAHGLGPFSCGNDYASQRGCVDPAVSQVMLHKKNEPIFLSTSRVGAFTLTSNAARKSKCVFAFASKVVANDTNAFANKGRSSWASQLLGHGSTHGALKNTYRLLTHNSHVLR